MSEVSKITSQSRLSFDPTDRSVINKYKSDQPKGNNENMQSGVTEKNISQENEISGKELFEAVDEANRIVFKEDSRFEFKIHEGTGRYLVKLVDNKTKEVIREIPPEKILDLIANIWEMVGILVDERG